MKIRSATQRAAGLRWRMVFAFALAACSSLKSGHVYPPDAAAKSRAKAANRCEHYEPPANSDAGSGPDLDRTFIFAAQRNDVGETLDNDGKPRYPSFGYDLDHTCTLSPDLVSSCKLEPGQTKTVVDGPLGQDNSANEVLFQTVQTARQFPTVDGGPGIASEVNATPELQRGRNTILVRIRNYNGQSNDRAVTLDLFAATLWDTPESGPAPRWDTHDRWRIAQPWLEDGALSNDAPRFSDPQAYVNNDVLVARFPTLLVGGSFAPSGLWHHAIVTARLVHVGDALEMHDMVIAGRWLLDEFLAFLSREFDTTTAQVSCLGSGSQQALDAFYSVQRQLLCQQADLNLDVDDGTHVCNAVSIVENYDMIAAELGDPIAIALPDWGDCPNALDCSLPPQPLPRPPPEVGR